MSIPVIFFHGKPSSHETTDKNLLDGLEAEISSFFFTKGELGTEDYLLVHIGEHRNQTYSAYTYFHRGRDTSHRGKGYFAITIVENGVILDDIISLYDYLKNRIYAGLIVGHHHIVDNTGTYQVYTLSSRNAALNGIAEQTETWIQGLRSQSIDKGFQEWNKSPDIRPINPDDTSNAILIKELKTKGTCCISSYIPTQEEMKLNELTNKYEALEKKYQEALIQIDSKDKRISQLQKQIEEISARNGDHCNRHSASEAFDEREYSRIDSECPESSAHKKSSGSKLMNFRIADIIIIALSVFSCVLSLTLCSGKKHASADEVITQEYTTTPQTTEEPIVEPEKNLRDNATDTVIRQTKTGEQGTPGEGAQQNNPEEAQQGRMQAARP